MALESCLALHSGWILSSGREEDKQNRISQIFLGQAPSQNHRLGFHFSIKFLEGCALWMQLVFVKAGLSLRPLGNDSCSLSGHPHHFLGHFRSAKAIPNVPEQVAIWQFIC